MTRLPGAMYCWVLSGLLAATGAMAGDTLKIATEGAYPPFNYLDDTGQPRGFDVDIADALCEQMGRTCEFVLEDWGTIIDGLEEGRYDAIVASMSITEERQRRVDFTVPYYVNRLNFIAAVDNEFEVTEAGLQGRVLGAQEETISGQWLIDHLDDVADVRLYETQKAAHQALAAGELDAVLADMLVQYFWLVSEEGAGFDFRGAPVYEDDLIAIAVRKGDDRLRREFNQALSVIRDKGIYQRINDRYFPFDIY